MIGEMKKMGNMNLGFEEGWGKTHHALNVGSILCFENQEWASVLSKGSHVLAFFQCWEFDRIIS